MRRAKSVDDYIENAEHWRDEIVRLREILRSTPLEEEVKNLKPGPHRKARPPPFDIDYTTHLPTPKKSTSGNGGR